MLRMPSIACAVTGSFSFLPDASCPCETRESHRPHPIRMEILQVICVLVVLCAYCSPSGGRRQYAGKSDSLEGLRSSLEEPICRAEFMSIFSNLRQASDITQDKNIP